MPYLNGVFGTFMAVALTFGAMGQSVQTVAAEGSDVEMAQLSDQPIGTTDMPQPISPLSRQLGNTPRSPGGTGFRPPRRILSCHRVRYPSPHAVCRW